MVAERSLDRSRAEEFLDGHSGSIGDYWRSASLPLFVLHQPVIILVAFFVVQWQMAWWLKMLIDVPTSFSLCVGLCEFVIRRVGWLRVGFGTPRRLPAPKGA